ncbi:hypothetical protein WP50_21120, partial [Lactiplantibacillus plantarum]
QDKEYNLCPNRVGIGTKANGSMANYVLTREESAHILPDNVSYKMAAMSEPLASCVHAMYQKINPTIKIIMGSITLGPTLMMLCTTSDNTFIMHPPA